MLQLFDIAPVEDTHGYIMNPQRAVTHSHAIWLRDIVDVDEEGATPIDTADFVKLTSKLKAANINENMSAQRTESKPVPPQTGPDGQPLPPQTGPDGQPITEQHTITTHSFSLKWRNGMYGSPQHIADSSMALRTTLRQLLLDPRNSDSNVFVFYPNERP